MATIVFKNAVVLVGGTEIHAALHELNVEYGAEMLDATVFGLNTRTNRGGLYTGSIGGQGFLVTAVGLEAVLWPNVGVDDVVFAVFPEGVSEGVVGGFAMKGVLEQFDLGGPVGTLANVSWMAQTRGIEA